MSPVPELDIFVDPKNPRDGILSIMKVLRPTWQIEDIQMTDLSTGYVNKNWKVSSNNHGDQDAILVHVVNTDMNTEEQKRTAQFVHDNDLGTKYPCFFTNGLCHEFVAGEIMSWDERERLYDDDVWKPIAEVMARYHTPDMLKKAHESKLRVFLSDLPDRVLQLVEMSKSLEGLPKSFVDAMPGAEEMQNTHRWFISFMQSHEAEVAVIHGDVNRTNIVMKNDGRTVLIDYDILGINFIAMDIAWYFLCYTDLRNFQLEDYPNDPYQEKWLRYYLTYRRKIEGNTDSVTDEDVANLKQIVEYGKIGALVQLTRAVMFIFIFSARSGREPLPAITGEIAWSKAKELMKDLQYNAPSLST